MSLPPTIERPEILRSAAIAVPLVAGAVLYLFRDSLSSSASGLAFVLFVALAAATGDRVAGYLAALSGAVGFDFFLTEPHLSLKVKSAEDIQFAIAITIVGLVVTEIALWGYRQRLSAYLRGDYLSRVRTASSSGSAKERAAAIGEALKVMLNASKAEWYLGIPPTGDASLTPEATVTYNGHDTDAPRVGFPTDRYLSIPVLRKGAVAGYFQLTFQQQVWPRREQLEVASLLAQQMLGVI